MPALDDRFAAAIELTAEQPDSGWRCGCAR